MPFEQDIAALVAAAGAICAYCRQPGSNTRGPDGRPWTRDHIVPRRKGDDDTPHNIALCCSSCNSAKQDSDEAAFTLQRAYGLPRSTARRLAEQSEAYTLAAYVRAACWWLEVRPRVDALSYAWFVELRVSWPRDLLETITTYSRSAADAAIDRICDASEAYWRTA